MWHVPQIIPCYTSEPDGQFPDFFQESAMYRNHFSFGIRGQTHGGFDIQTLKSESGNVKLIWLVCTTLILDTGQIRWLRKHLVCATAYSE